MSQVPELLKCDPPSWWAGHTHNPVRLMLYGRNLAGASIRSSSPDIRFGPVKVSAAGNYLFVDAKIKPGCRPGPRAFEVSTKAGTASGTFEVLAPLKGKKGRMKSFSPDDVFYLIMPDRFAKGAAPAIADPEGLIDRSRARSYHGGNLQGVADHLDYLKQLGVTAIWLTPMYKNTERLHPVNSWSTVPFTDYHGYGPVDYYAMDAHFGDFAGLRRLIEAAHGKGLKIIVDQVSNHTGPHHPWVKEPPTPTWYHGTLESHAANTFQPWVVADPYASDELRASALDGWFGDILPDLNQDDPEMARYMLQNILWWIGMTGMDGMRHDVVGFVPRGFWRDVFKAVKREYPDFKAVGEVNGDTAATVSYYQGGHKGFDGIDTGLDSLFDFPLREMTRAVLLEGKPIDKLAMTLSHDRVYADPSMLVTCVGLHDDSRFMGHPKATVEALRLGLTFVLTTRGIPLIYYGDELAMLGGDDPDNRRDFPGGWEGDERSAFTRRGLSAEETGTLDHVMRLTRARLNSDALRRGELVHLAAGENVYVYARRQRGAGAIVVLNKGDKAAAIDCSVRALKLQKAALEDVLGGPRAAVAEGRLRLELPPRSSALYLY